MEITVFGRTIRIFTVEQLNKIKVFIFITIGSNGVYRFAILCFCAFLLFCVICRIRRKKGDNVKRSMVVKLILYIVFLLSALVFSRPVGKRSIITWNKSFFMTNYGYHETSLLMVVIKFCMVIPFGVLIKKIFIYKEPAFLPVICAIITGASIEILKYYLGRGRAAIGSALVLMIGTIIGIIYECIIQKLRNYRGKR